MRYPAAALRGIEIAKVYEDAGRSGLTFVRRDNVRRAPSMGLAGGYRRGAERNVSPIIEQIRPRASDKGSAEAGARTAIDAGDGLPQRVGGDLKP